ncbi:MAG: DUF134 domain-containing protein [Peptostreptococcaceae bacterium]
MELKHETSNQTGNSNEIKITFQEVQVIKLIDVDNLNIKSCSKKMNLSIDEVNMLLSSARKKLASSLIDGKTIKLLPQQTKEKITTLCKFRCAVCGEIYTVNYLESKILCPLCYSNKIMSNKEAGFYK